MPGLASARGRGREFGGQGTSRAGLLALENLPFLVHNVEVVTQTRYALGGAEEENSPRLESVMEQREQPFLRGGFHIN